MQNAKRKKPALIFKPYTRGRALDGSAVKQGLALLLICLLFAVLYVVAGLVTQLGGPAVQIILNLALVLACAAILYGRGLQQGVNEVTFGEIVYARQEKGIAPEQKELSRCFHPAKGIAAALLAALFLVALTLPYALTAARQTYVLQPLPGWVGGFENQTDIMAPLSYYRQPVSLGVMDMLKYLSRLLTLPFVRMVSENPDGLLLVDRLSPLLACLPLIGYPLGYMNGPRARARVHGAIQASAQRAQRRRKKEIQAQKARTEKKNELI